MVHAGLCLTLFPICSLRHTRIRRLSHPWTRDRTRSAKSMLTTGKACLNSQSMACFEILLRISSLSL